MDRKALIREYKANRRPMGVFQVRNTLSGKVLLGSTADLPSMLNRQRAQLQMGAHPNRDLQADWRAHGPGAFAFEVLDTLTPSDEAGYDLPGGLAHARSDVVGQARTFRGTWIQRGAQARRLIARAGMAAQGGTRHGPGSAAAAAESPSRSSSAKSVSSESPRSEATQ